MRTIFIPEATPTVKLEGRCMQFCCLVDIRATQLPEVGIHVSLYTLIPFLKLKRQLKK